MSNQGRGVNQELKDKLYETEKIGNEQNEKLARALDQTYSANTNFQNTEIELQAQNNKIKKVTEVVILITYA